MISRVRPCSRGFLNGLPCASLQRIPCSSCTKRFPSRDALRFHMRMTHGVGDPIVCPHCDRREFNSRSQFFTHRRWCAVEHSATKPGKTGSFTRYPCISSRTLSSQAFSSQATRHSKSGHSNFRHSYVTYQIYKIAPISVMISRSIFISDMLYV